MHKYYFIIFLLVADIGFAQNISNEPELIKRLNAFSGGKSKSDTVFNNTYELLELCDTLLEQQNRISDDNAEIQLIKFDLIFIQSFSYFYLTGIYLKENSYSYGIQLFEKGLDHFKKSLEIFNKCQSDIPDLESKKVKLKTLYDFCFNYYCEYKMKKIDEYDLFKMVKNRLPEIKDLTIVNWILSNNY